MQKHRIIIDRGCGFFSDFLTASAGLLYCYEQGFKPHVHWQNELYSEQPVNLFDLYFHQEHDEGPFDVVHQNLTPYGYVLGLEPEWWEKTDVEISYCLTRMVRVYQTYNTFDSPIINTVPKDFFKGKRVLGFHKRDTDVGDSGKTWACVPDETWVRLLHRYMASGQYDQLFCITDNELSLEVFKKEFGSTLLHTDSYRSPSRKPPHYGQGRPPGNGGARLAEGALRDMLLLSQTDFMLLSRSNVSVVALLKAMQNYKFSDKQFHFVYQQG